MNDTRQPLLLVEDSDPDAEALQRLARKLPLSWPVTRVTSGEAALDYLYKRGEYADVLRPVLILLDVNLPGIRGPEILSIIKGDAALRTLPVIMFSSSTRAEDVDGAYARGANSYLYKPTDVEELKGVANALENFWFKVARLPGMGGESPG